MIPGWKTKMQSDYLEYLRAHPGATPTDVASRFAITECRAIYWLTDLARDGRVRILAVEAVENGETPCAPESANACQRKEFCPVNPWMGHSTAAGQSGHGSGRWAPESR
jgi:hypothetical protein